MTPPKRQKLLDLIKLGSFELRYMSGVLNLKMFGDMVLRYMPNSGYGGPLGIGVMTICVFYVSTKISIIEYFVVYEFYKSEEVSHLSSHQISYRMPSELCLETHF